MTDVSRSDKIAAMQADGLLATEVSIKQIETVSCLSCTVFSLHNERTQDSKRVAILLAGFLLDRIRTFSVSL